MMFSYAINACTGIILTMRYVYVHANNTVTSLSNKFAIA